MMPLLLQPAVVPRCICECETVLCERPCPNPLLVAPPFYRPLEQHPVYLALSPLLSLLAAGSRFRSKQQYTNT